MKWTVNDVFRLLAMLAAIVFFGIGLWMVVKGIQADGSIDIQSAVVSGKLHTGSAGLFVLLLSFLIISIIILPGFAQTGVRTESAISRSSHFKELFAIFLTLCVLEVLSWYGAWKGVTVCWSAGLALMFPIIGSVIGIFTALSGNNSEGASSGNKANSKE